MHIEAVKLSVKGFFIFVGMLLTSVSYSQSIGNKPRQKIAVLKNEKWWGGAVNKAHEMPFRNSFVINLSGDSYGNQTSPLLISSMGRYIWSENPFAFRMEKDSLTIEFTSEGDIYETSEKTLRSAYSDAANKFFKADGKMPDSLLFSSPQYNTWIELIYNQNQNDILKYAKDIVANGFPPGVLMIDDNWFASYGDYSFRRDRFPDAKLMVDELHRMGFKVMVWICPFISPDSEAFREAMSKRIILFNKKARDNLRWSDATEPALIKWWNGYSAVLDLSNPDAERWIKNKLNIIQKEYGIDGFKFDAGDAEFYNSDQIVSFKNISANEHCERWGAIGLAYPLNEYRAMWKNGGKPLVERLRDKYHTWDDLQKLIPHAAMAGMLGYAFVCPDMIGGGDYSSFINNEKLDQDLIVRSAQCHALMPMMQFSVAPWRVLDSVHLNAVKKAVSLRQTMVANILLLAREASVSGAPIVRNMEFAFPHQGYEMINDQFMLGKDILVAPILTKSGMRKILLPGGNWRDMNTGKIIIGPKVLEMIGGLELLPYYQRLPQ